jgi:4-hydroxy-tetrahydrodipicolinate reductase
MIFGDGHLGKALAAALRARGEPAPVILGRPAGGRHPATRLVGADLAFEASIPDAVHSNVAAALASGCRQFVIATTGWDDGRDALDAALRTHGGAAVVAANFSLGVAALLRLVDVAGSLFATLDAFDPYILEWHRRAKADRPSGTARELASRLLAVDPRKSGIAFGSDGPPSLGELEVVSVRAGASPGMHVVGFDAPGETLELRLTARDRSAYAAGALAAADWLRVAERAPGIHGFDEVVDEIFTSAAEPAAPSRKLWAVASLAG